MMMMMMMTMMVMMLMMMIIMVPTSVTLALLLQTGHPPAGLQRGTSARSTRARSHPAGRQPVRLFVFVFLSVIM